MKWLVQYRIKGDPQIRTEEVDVHFTRKHDVKTWWVDKSLTFVNCIGSNTIGGHRKDKEYINCVRVE